MRLLPVILLLLPLSALAQTQVPNVFEDGTPATAAAVNENFEALETGLNQIETAISTAEIAVDCSNDKAALRTLMASNESIDSLKTYRITGTCEVDRDVSFYGSVRILGGENAALTQKDVDIQNGDIGTFWYVYDNATLRLDGLKVNDFFLRARRGAVIHLVDVVFEGPAQVEAKSGSIVELWRDISVPDEYVALPVYARNGSTVQLAYGLNASLKLYLETGSSAWCRYCEGVKFVDLELDGNSSFLGFRSSEQHLDIDNFSMRANSSLIQSRGPCDSPYYAEPEFRDGTSVLIWQPSEGEECNQ